MSKINELDISKINKLACQMKIEFPTYDELSEKTKSVLDKFKSDSIEMYVWQDYETGVIQFDNYNYISFEEDNFGYGILFDIRSENISSERLEYLEEQYDEETVQKILTMFNDRMTTVNTFILIDKYQYMGKGLTKGDRPALPKSFLNYRHWKEMQESGSDLTKGGEQLRGGWEYVSSEFVPITVKYYVNGVLNTNESLVPVPYFGSDGSINVFAPRYIDIMPSDVNGLPDIIHRDAIRSLSKNYCIIPYAASFIAMLRAYNSDAEKDIYISNYNYDSYYQETETYFIKLPKDKYVIDSNGMIRDPENTENPADLSEFNINSNLMDNGYYDGDVYAVLDIEKLGIETVTGKMIINTGFEKSAGNSIFNNLNNGKDDNSGEVITKGENTKAIQYLNQLYINPIYCDEDIDLSNEIECNDIEEWYSQGRFPYLCIGDNGFGSNPNYIDWSGFGARINGVNYDPSSNYTTILGFKDDGYPNSLYTLKRGDDSFPTDLVCGYIDESTEQLVEIDQDVTAYIFDMSKLMSQAAQAGEK